MPKSEIFEIEYKKLNKAQKEAVEALDGPVMVVAGPGTGKTQILALRIANILQKTDIKPDGILCLTFTNSAVEAMKNRLNKYLGETSEKVNVFTFHSFAMFIIEEHFKVLGLTRAPKLLEDLDRAIFFEQILADNEWEYLRPRGNSLRYFQDLKSLISLLKRERITSREFETAIEKEIKFLEQDENSISTRGESKGELKKETVKDIQSLVRSREVVKFIKLYEEAKKEKNLLDYDDILESMTRLVEISHEVASLVRERYLYVLIDEHQDSSRVQNEFLARVWGPVERPDIFVVGDDRQLIYGFSGASIEHFQGFKKTFPDAKLITLIDNYRSTQVILDASHALLESVMSEARLQSQKKGEHPIKLLEADSPDEEIIAAGLDIKEKGLNPSDCAILVPKNKQVRNALDILHSMGVPVSTHETLGLFDQEEAHAFLRVLKIINDGDTVSLSMSFLDKISGVEPLAAHGFIVSENMREFSWDNLASRPRELFASNDNVDKWISKLIFWKNDFQNNGKQSGLKSLISRLGEDLLGDKTINGIDKKIVSGKEILDTVLGLLARGEEKNPDITLAQFISYLDKLESYHEHVPLLTTSTEGVKVLTMHSSKGLEFEYVWIAHMDEKSLSGGKKPGFTLPSSIRERIEEHDIDAIKRKLYVAITRAKHFCTLSYASLKTNGKEDHLAKIIDEMPAQVFERQKVSSTKKIKTERVDLSGLLKLAATKYKDRHVSVSLLNNFFACPWQWYFRNLLQLQEPRVETLEFGIFVHSSIEKILKMTHIPELETVKSIVTEEVLKREFGSLRDGVRREREALAIVLPWVKNRLKDISPNRKTEESLAVKDDHYPYLKIYGKIDLIENLNSSELRVTDFKTGSVRKKGDIEKLDDEGRMSGYLRQLSMYSYLIKQNPKWKASVRESRLEFLEALPAQAGKNRSVFYDRVISDKELTLLVKDITDYDESVKSGEWVARPCNYNSFGKNTECPYCKLAQIYKN